MVNCSASDNPRSKNDCWYIIKLLSVHSLVFRLLHPEPRSILVYGVRERDYVSWGIKLTFAYRVRWALSHTLSIGRLASPVAQEAGGKE